MSMQFIDLKQQYARIKNQVQKNMHRVLEHGQYINGPEVTQFEKRMAEFSGAACCVGTSNGTSALQVSMRTLGIGSGDEVITTPFTFIATVSMIQLVGATPVLVDIDPETCNINPELIGAAVTAKTKAIIAVDLFGQCADYDAIWAVANKYGLMVISDAAQSMGAEYKGRQSGTMGLISCTSFYPAKPLGAYGDAGACFTDDPQLAQKLRQICNHGQDGSYNHVCFGTNARLDTLQAAILLAKLDIFADEVKLRQQHAACYTQKLNGGVVRTPTILANTRSSYAQYTVFVRERDALQAYLREQGIPTAIHYPKPVHFQPAFSHLHPGGTTLHYAEKAAREVLSLPMHPYLDVTVIDKIVRHIDTFMKCKKST